MNPILSLLSGGTAGNGKAALYARALAAMARGESAESFMADLAKTDPRFKGIDMANLEQSANKLCQEKGVNKERLASQIGEEIKGLN